MKVGELIDKLSDLDPTLDVYTARDNAGDSFADTVDVSLWIDGDGELYAVEEDDYYGPEDLYDGDDGKLVAVIFPYW